MLGLALPWRAAQSAAKPYRVSLIGDEFTADGWMMGLRIELDPDWKTYWRMPGDAGIPPQFEWKPSAPAHIEVLYPVPERFNDQSGETIGFKHEVVFPVVVKPQTIAPLRLDLGLFLGVCREVCIPVRESAAIELGTAARDPKGSALVSHWLGRIPERQDFVSSAAIELKSGVPHLVLGLSRKVEDIFVETEGNTYFRAPQFSNEGASAALAVDNVTGLPELKGATLRLTAKAGSGGLEQSVTLA